MINIHHLTSGTFPLELKKAWATAYGDDFRYKYPERFFRIHVDNPYKTGDETGLIYVTKDNEVAAWSSVIFHKIKFGKAILKCGVAADTYTLPQYRKMGLWSILQQNLMDLSEVYWSIEMSAINRLIRKKSGLYNMGQPLEYYFKPIKPLNKESFRISVMAWAENWSYILRTFLSHKVVTNMLFWLLNRVLVSNRLNRLDPLLHFKKIDLFDKETDILWSEVSKNLTFANYRDSAYLNWRYENQPLVSYFKYKIYIKEDLIGFVVFRISDELQSHESYITELVVKEELFNMVPSIVCFCEEIIQKNNGKSIYFATSQSNLLKHVEESGFHHYESSIPLWVAKGSTIEKTDLENVISPDAKWLISLGDQDMDQVNTHNKQPEIITLIKIANSVISNKIKSLVKFKYFKNDL